MDEIVSTREGALRRVARHGGLWTDIVPGVELTMRDGSIWFHPYDGSQPVEIVGGLRVEVS